MSAQQQIAAPAPLARLEVVSPWRSAAQGSRERRWLAGLAEAWREGMALYIRAGAHRGHWGGFW